MIPPMEPDEADFSGGMGGPGAEDFANGAATLAAAMVREAQALATTAAALRGTWSGPTWLLTDGGYARRPIFRAARDAGWRLVARLRRDAHLNDLPPFVPPGRRRPGRPAA